MLGKYPAIPRVLREAAQTPEAGQPIEQNGSRRSAREEFRRFDARDVAIRDSRCSKWFQGDPRKYQRAVCRLRIAGFTRVCQFSYRWSS